MAALPLQHGVLEDAVPVQIQSGGIALPQLQHNLGLELGRLPGIGTHIADLLPALQVLLDRLPVEKYHRYVGLPGLADDPGGVGPVHQVDAQHVVAQGEEAVDLPVLGVLVLLGVGDGDLDPSALLLAPGLGKLLHSLGHIGDVGIRTLIDRYPDAEGLGLTPPLGDAAAQAQQRRRQEGSYSFFHQSSSFRLTTPGAGAGPWGR